MQAKMIWACTMNFLLISMLKLLQERLKSRCKLCTTIYLSINFHPSTRSYVCRLLLFIILNSCVLTWLSRALFLPPHKSSSCRSCNILEACPTYKGGTMLEVLCGIRSRARPGYSHLALVLQASTEPFACRILSHVSVYGSAVGCWNSRMWPQHC